MGFAHTELKIKAGGLQSHRWEETGQFQVYLRAEHVNPREMCKTETSYI